MQFVESEFTLRSAEEHAHHCALLERDDIPSLDHQHYSITYGVNRRALLDTLRYVDITSGILLPDIMHDILEGALPFEIKLMLKVILHQCNNMQFLIARSFVFRFLSLTISYLHLNQLMMHSRNSMFVYLMVTNPLHFLLFLSQQEIQTCINMVKLLSNRNLSYMLPW